MAKIRRNAVVHGASGKFGDLIVFRQLPDGSTILTEAPPKRPNAEPTEKQKAQRARFQQAVLYGRGVLQNPELKAQYEAKANQDPLLSAYNVAVADFSKAPSIDEIDVSGYTGKAGDLITITASDDFMVKEVQVTIYNGDGKIADQGLAEQDTTFLDKWTWTASKANQGVSGDKIVVSVSDMAGNFTEMEETM